MAEPVSRPVRRAQGAAALLAVVPVLALAAILLWPARPILLWNASASSPVGLYAVVPGRRARLGDMVIAWAPPSARSLAARRHYLPARVPLVKRVAAVSGARVCAIRARIFVNGRVAAARRAHDPAGRPMPWWSGCSTLGKGDLLLLSSSAPNSFDGRYFGPTRADEILGKATLLWHR